jgi:uncharacterized protein
VTVDRLFLDANVLFSAAYRPDAGIARLWKLNNVELLTAHYAAEEARINLIDREQQQRLAELLVGVRIVTGISRCLGRLACRRKIALFCKAALHAGATHLLTGDKQHFGQYFGRSLGGVLVLPPAEYFQRHRH